MSACLPFTPVHFTSKRIKDGRHVVLDFYDLLIEDTMACSRNEFDSSFPKGNAGAGLVPPGLAQPTPAGWPGTTIDRTRKRIKDGRHVVLDFYDLLIEAIMFNNAQLPRNAGMWTRGSGWDHGGFPRGDPVGLL